MRFQNVGLKVSDASALLSNRSQMESVATNFDYFEFLSPNLNFPKIQKLKTEFGMRMLAHGNHIGLLADSLASVGISKSISSTLLFCIFIGISSLVIAYVTHSKFQKGYQT